MKRMQGWWSWFHGAASTIALFLHRSKLSASTTPEKSCCIRTWYTWSYEQAESNGGRRVFSFRYFLSVTLEFTEIEMTKDLTVLQQYLSIMRISSYDGNKKKWLWKRKNERPLEKALEKSNTFFLPVQRTREHLWSPSLAVSSTARVKRGACPWTLFLLTLRSPEIAHQDP